MSRSFLFIGVVTAVWAISITLADKTPSQAVTAKQRGDQTITSEDDLVAPSAETNIVPNQHTDKHNKKNEVGVTNNKKVITKPSKKYHPSKRLSGKKKKFNGPSLYFPKVKPGRPFRNDRLRQPHKGSSKHVKPKVEKGGKKKVEEAERRDSGYGPPAPYSPPQRKVIIKQAGPSKQFAWVGHQHYHNPRHNVPGHIFAAADLPKWTLMGNNVFQANLLYPGKKGSSPAKSPATYKPKPKPAPAAPVYVPPKPAAPSYSPPAPSVPAYQPAKPAAPVYTQPAPSYKSPVVPSPTYGSPNPFVSSAGYNSPKTTAAPPPVYQPSASPPSVYVGQPSYVPSYPSIQYVPSHPTAAPTPASTTAASYPTQSVYNSYTAYQNNFPTYSALPAAPSSSAVLPAVSSQQPNAYNVPITVEETGYTEGSGDGGEEVFYIFYEDKKPAASYDAPQYKSPPPQNDISSYIVEDVQSSQPTYPAATTANSNQFSAPKVKDIHTIYVPFENAVNIPETYDVSVASSFGYTGGAPSQQAGTGAAPPNYSGFPNFPVTGSSSSPPSYDSSISSYDAPILDDNSYTAKSPIRDVLYYGDATGLQQPERHPRPVRNLRLLPAVPDEPNTPSKSLRSPLNSASQEAHLVNGKYSYKLLPGKSIVPYGTRLGPRKQYDIAVPGL